MKAKKIAQAFIAFFILTNVLYAANPNKDKTAEMPTKAIKRINEYVALDSSQNAILNIKAKACYGKYIEAKNIKDKRKIIAMYKKASEEFRASLDSILTPEQKEQLDARRNANNDTIKTTIDNKKRVK